MDKKLIFNVYQAQEAARIFSSFQWLYNTRFEIWVELNYYFTSLKIICQILLITSDESRLVSIIRKSVHVLRLVNKVQLVCSTFAS